MRGVGLPGQARLTPATSASTLAPRINAAGRLERAMPAVEMLTTDDAARAEDLAENLDDCNTQRQEVEQTHRGRGARHDRGPGRAGGPRGDRPRATRLAPGRHRHRRRPAGRDLPPAERSSSPWTSGIGQGSGRSIPGFDLYRGHPACSDGLPGFGGHTAAAGLKLPTRITSTPSPSGSTSTAARV